MAVFRHKSPDGTAFRKLWLWISGAESDVPTSPTITAGAGAPTASEPKGSTYHRTDGSSSSEVLYVATDSAGTWAALTGA